MNPYHKPAGHHKPIHSPSLDSMSTGERFALMFGMKVFPDNRVPPGHAIVISPRRCGKRQLSQLITLQERQLEETMRRVLDSPTSAHSTHSNE